MKAERPLECSECRKEFTVFYTEVVGDVITRTAMCSDCPALQRKLYGIAEGNERQVGLDHERVGLCCGTCGVTLESIRMGHPLGCVECYEVFEDVIVKEMQTNKLMARYVAEITKSTMLHIGRMPGEVAGVSLSMRLIALNEALSEVLNREDYEQAAKLRDQIKKIEEEHGVGDSDSSGDMSEEKDCQLKV